MAATLKYIQPDAEEFMIHLARVSSDNQDNPEYEKENYSLKHFLIEYHAHYKIPKAAQTIQSVNTKEEYDKAIKLVGDSPQRINLAPNVR